MHGLSRARTGSPPVTPGVPRPLVAAGLGSSHLEPLSKASVRAQCPWAPPGGGGEKHPALALSPVAPPSLASPGAHQGRILHVVPQQPRVVEGVFGLLLHGIHWPLLHLMLDGLEELVQRFAGTVLQQGGRLSLGGTLTPTRRACPARLPTPACRAPTFRYWYRQMDIQLDSILSTTVSDLESREVLYRDTPSCC